MIRINNFKDKNIKKFEKIKFILYLHYLLFLENLLLFLIYK